MPIVEKCLWLWIKDPKAVSEWQWAQFSTAFDRLKKPNSKKAVDWSTICRSSWHTLHFSSRKCTLARLCQLIDSLALSLSNWPLVINRRHRACDRSWHWCWEKRKERKKTRTGKWMPVKYANPTALQSAAAAASKSLFFFGICRWWWCTTMARLQCSNRYICLWPSGRRSSECINTALDYRSCRIARAQSTFCTHKFIVFRPVKLTNFVSKCFSQTQKTSMKTEKFKSFSEKWLWQREDTIVRQTFSKVISFPTSQAQLHFSLLAILAPFGGTRATFYYYSTHLDKAFNKNIFTINRYFNEQIQPLV